MQAPSLPAEETTQHINTTQHWVKTQVVVNGHQSGPKPFLAFCCGGGSEPTTVLFRVEPKTKAHTD